MKCTEGYLWCFKGTKQNTDHRSVVYLLFEKYPRSIIEHGYINYCLPVLAVTMAEARVLLTIWCLVFVLRVFSAHFDTWGFYCLIIARHYG